MYATLPAKPDVEPIPLTSWVVEVLDQTALFAFFVSGSGILLTKGPGLLIGIASFLASHLQLAVPYFQ